MMDSPHKVPVIQVFCRRITGENIIYTMYPHNEKLVMSVFPSVTMGNDSDANFKAREK